ncbi:ENACB [Mytilus edulis]|uniref:SCNN1B n=1 Tax=Mytilus edulis TaxID=6550 RepID=A0A8S3Q5U7_MYTED|nr:ENACB [Mytilus edulis]
MDDMMLEVRAEMRIIVWDRNISRIPRIQNLLWTMETIYGKMKKQNHWIQRGKQKSFNRLCVRFAEKTSMQGLPWINAAKLWYAKVFWVFLLLCGIAGMTLHLYSLIDQFLQFDVQVSISLGFNHLVLPAVTVCNVNAVKKSELNIMSEALQSLVAQTDPSRFNVPPGKKRKKRYVDEFDNINFDNLSRSYDFTNKGGQKKDNNFQITQTFQALYMQHPRNFTWFQTEDYGNCFTIQSEEFVVTSAGPDSGKHDKSRDSFMGFETSFDKSYKSTFRTTQDYCSC